MPDKVQAPISAPTASRMTIGVMTDEAALCSALTISSHACPFFRMIMEVITEQNISAICSELSIALVPNRKTEPPIENCQSDQWNNRV